MPPTPDHRQLLSCSGSSGVGLDLGLPLVKTGASNRCQPTDPTAGGILTVASWILQAPALAFATLFIAGFTNAVRKT